MLSIWTKNRNKPLALTLVICMFFGMFFTPAVSYAAESYTSEEASQIAENALFQNGSTKGAITYYQNKSGGKLNDWWEMAAVKGSGGNLSLFGLPQVPELSATPTLSDYYTRIFVKLLRGEDASSDAASLAAMQNPSGAFSTATNNHIWTMIALDAYNRKNLTPVLYNTAGAIDILTSQQFTTSGGFAYDPVSWSNEDSNTTAIAALAIAPYVSSYATAAAIQAKLLPYLQSVKAGNGGFKYDGPNNTTDDANSDASVIIGLLAAGVDFNNTIYGGDGKTPLDALLRYQLASGAFFIESSPTAENAYATKQAAVALADLFSGSSVLGTLQKNATTYGNTAFVQLESSNFIETKGYITMVAGSETVADAAQLAWVKAGKSGTINLADYKVFVNGSLTAAVAGDAVPQNASLLIVPTSVTHLAAFTSSTAAIGMNTPITLTLNKTSFPDGTMAPVTGATITVNGSTYSGYPPETNSNGQITLNFQQAGTYVISTSTTTDSAGATISRPICTITVSAQAAYQRTVSVRVEGIASGSAITPYSYSKTFTAASDGTKIITPVEVLKQYSASQGWEAPVFYGSMLSTINHFPQASDPADYWMWGLNGASANFGMGDYEVKNGDEIVYFYGGSSLYPTMSAIKVGANNGSPDYATLTFSANGWYGPEAVPGANVTWNGKTYITNSSGIVTIPAIEIPAGKQLLQIEKYAANGVASVVRFPDDYRISLSAEEALASGTTSAISSTDSPTTYTTTASNPGSLSVAAEKQVSGNTTIATLPGIAVYSDRGAGTAPVEIIIQPGTKLSAASTWNGLIQMPKVEANSSVSITGNTVNMVISVGSSESLTFDKPVRLVLPGTAGKKVGFMNGGTVTEITDTLLFDNYNTAAAALSGNGAAKIVSGNDTIIWTKHFTNFVAYQTTGDSGDSGNIPPASVVYMSIEGVKGSIYMPKTSYTLKSGDTAVSILTKNVSSALTRNSGYGSYVYSIYGLAEFDQGSESGWLYKVNGKYPGYTANSYTLKANDYVQWVYTKDLGKDVGGQVSGVTAVDPTKTATLEAKVDSSGVATASLKKTELSEFVKGSTNTLEISSSIATLTFDKTAMTGILANAQGDLKITAAKLDNATLSSEVKTEVGSRPVYEFKVLDGSNLISSFSGKVTVSIPYTPAAGEDSSSLVIYYINDSGKLEMIKGCKYDTTKKSIVFTTDHFSKYAIGYNAVSFTDTKGHWSEVNINFLAARNIINGKAQGKFMPNDNITRAEFITILANKAGVDLKNTSASAISSFQDVKATDWFAGAVAWASSNNIAAGADGKFRPNDRITRQEMAVILDRYITNIDKVTMKATGTAVTFSDSVKIAAYAKSSVEKMQKMGIINGKTAATFAPVDFATRAETAKMIAVLMQTAI